MVHWHGVRLCPLSFSWFRCDFLLDLSMGYGKVFLEHNLTERQDKQMSENDTIAQEPKKVILQIELFPYEKEAFSRWIKGRYASYTDAIRSHIRKVTKLDPEEENG